MENHSASFLSALDIEANGATGLKWRDTRVLSTRSAPVDILARGDGLGAREGIGER
jgi:hypothetical protein